MSRTRNKPGGLSLLLVVALGFISTVQGHTFVERLMRVTFNGTMVGNPGYMRGMVDRNGGFYADAKVIKTILPPIDKSLVMHESQRTANYSTELPPLTASPGDVIALQYQENGHVTSPQDKKPANRGTVYIYGATELSPDTMLLDVHYQWNKDGTGGDKKGKLLATRPFDDGICFEVKGESPSSVARQQAAHKTFEPPMNDRLWCQNDLALPDDLEVGKPYTLIWVWDWPYLNKNGVPYPPVTPPGDAGSYPRKPGKFGEWVETAEIYTSVMDINIVDPCDKVLGDDTKGPLCKTPGKSSRVAYQMLEKDLNKASIGEQLTNNWLVDLPVGFGNTTSSGPPSKGPVAAPVPPLVPSDKASTTVNPSTSSSFSLSSSTAASGKSSSKATTTDLASSPTTPPKEVILVTVTIPAQTYTYTTTVSDDGTSEASATHPALVQSSSGGGSSTPGSSSTTCTCSSTTTSDASASTTAVSQGAKIPLGTAPKVTGFGARDEAAKDDKRGITWTG